MKIHWKKTCINILTGSILIFLILMVLMLRTLDISRLSKQYVYTVTEEELENGKSGYSRNGKYYLAQVDDAWITIDIKEKGEISAVIVDSVPQTDLVKKTQIYYTNEDEFSSEKYIEEFLNEGLTKFDFVKETSCKKLRIDFTSLKGEALEINKIDIVYSDKNRKELWVLCPIIIFLYTVFIFIKLNKEAVSNKILQNNNLGPKYDFISQICSLAFSDFQARFSGSYLGMFWGILQPLSTILLFWFVFQVGFRSNPIEDVPFILWLSAGMIPWNYFYDSWFGTTSSFTAYGYIVKKVVFKVEVLPLIKALSSAIMNGIFNVILIVIYILYGEFPGVHILDMFYFSLCIFVFSLGLSFFTATLNVFMKDIGQFLGIVLQFLMWMTPMMWNYTMIPEKFDWFYKLNPLHYVINGYRESLINNYWFFHHYKLMIYFWIVSINLMILGYRLMKKLKPHFADVL